MNEIKECETWLGEDYRSVNPHDLRRRKYPSPCGDNSSLGDLTEDGPEADKLTSPLRYYKQVKYRSPLDYRPYLFVKEESFSLGGWSKRPGLRFDFPNNRVKFLYIYPPPSCTRDHVSL